MTWSPFGPNAIRLPSGDHDGDSPPLAGELEYVARRVRYLDRVADPFLESRVGDLEPVGGPNRVVVPIRADAEEGVGSHVNARGRHDREESHHGKNPPVRLDNLPLAALTEFGLDAVAAL